MKILQISYNLTSGGAERFVVDLCNRFSDNTDDEVVLATTDDGRIPRLNHYAGDLSSKVKRRFVGTEKKVGLKPKCLWGMYRIIKEEKPDVVHIHCNIIIGYLPALFYRKPVYIHTLHNLAHKCCASPIFRRINEYFYRKLVHAITISTECQESFVSYYKNCNSRKITNGREPLELSNKTAEVKAFIDSIKVSPDSPVFIHVARCFSQKNPELLYSTFGKLASEGLDFLLIVLGKDHEKYAEKYKNSKQIYVVGEKRNVGDYMSCADFFVLSSNYEGLPLSLLEAMSMGVTPVSTPAGGVVDVIRNGENGYITRTFDAGEYEELIRYAIAHKDELSKELIKKEYEQDYSMKRCSSVYYEEYKKWLKEK